MSIEAWTTFFLIAAVATAVPGPAMLLVASHSISFGVTRTVFTIVGNITGLSILSALSVLGLGTLLVHSPAAFSTVKIIGAIYLIYLGVSLWRRGISPLNADTDKDQKHAALMFAQGIAIALSNPKAILYTTALLPQFIDPSISLLPQFLVLVITSMFLSFACLLSCAIAVRHTFTAVRSSKLYEITGKLFGGTFIGAGCLLAISKNDSA